MTEMRCLGYAASSLFAVVLLSCVVQAQQPLKQRPASGKPAPNTNSATLDPGGITADVYRSPSFGFTYKLPFGWVDRTQAITDDSNDPKKSILLLAVFERPPEATGDTVNSAVVVAAEAASSYPGLRNAENYFGPLTELTKSKGLNVVNQPYEFPVGAKQLMRGDFSKPLGSLTMCQSTLVMMEKGYVVSFTFIGGSEDEVDALVEALSFSAKKPATPHK
jgi:hypothetical protein